MSNGRGGQPGKIVPRVNGRWVADLLPPVTQIELAKLLGKGVPQECWIDACQIYATHMRRTAVFDGPLATDDHKAGDRALGLQHKKLLKRVSDAETAIREALDSELSHDLQGLVLDQFTPKYDAAKPFPNLRDHLDQAWKSLVVVENILNLLQIVGVEPNNSLADVKKETGGKLKALARDSELPMEAFVKAFKIHQANSDEAFTQWFKTLK